MVESGMVVGFCRFAGCAAAWVCVNGEKQGQRPGGCGIRDAWLGRWIRVSCGTSKKRAVCWVRASGCT